MRERVTFGKRSCVKIEFISVSIFNVILIFMFIFVFVFVWCFALSFIVRLVWCFDSVDLMGVGEWCYVVFILCV